jgi:type I restriction enzyme, S subunit
MKTVALREVALSLQDGPFGSNLKSSHYVDVGVRVVRLQNIGVGYFDDRDRAYVTKDHFARLKKHECQPGDVLIATLGDPIVRACLQPSWLEVALQKADCLRLRCDTERVVPGYIVQFLNSDALQSQAKGLAHGQTRPRVNLGQLGAVRLPLPSLAEQRRIANVLDQAAAVRVKRRQTLAEVDALAQAVFVDMFGDIIANDRLWPSANVGDFVDRFEGGKNIAPSNGDAQTGYRVLKVSAVTSGIFDATESKLAPPSYAPPPSHVVRDGDLLFSRANTSALVGATALVQAPPANLLLPDKLWRFVWHTPARADPRYVHYLFQRPEFRQVISRNATGTSGSMKNISQAKVLAVSCGLPPLEMQQEFGRRMESLASLRRALAEHLEQLESLFLSLQHRAFNGAL